MLCLSKEEKNNIPPSAQSPLFKKVQMEYAQTRCLVPVLPPILRCDECEDECEPHLCGACQVAKYCSQACQRKAWKSGHKAICKSLQPK